MKYPKRLLLLILITMFCCTNIVRAEGEDETANNNSDPNVVEEGLADEDDPIISENEQDPTIIIEGNLETLEGEEDTSAPEENLNLFKVNSAVLGRQNEAEEVNDTGEHYLAFASDLHGSKDAIANAFGPEDGIFKDVEYAALLGNMLENEDVTGESSAIYDQIITYIPESATFHLLNGGIYDINLEDDIKIVKATTSERYEGKAADGTPLFYVFSIDYNNISKTTQLSQAGVTIFKRWLPKVPYDVPIIVISHTSLTRCDGENIGAEYWHEALNYAATGVEGLTYDVATEDIPIKRNVIFLSGHNCIDDPNEYAFLSNSMMPIQEDTQQGHQRIDKSRIYYNALTPGYLIASGNACLVRVTDEKDFSLTKYKNGEIQNAWINGETKEIMDRTLTIKHSDPSPGPVIIEQPEDTSVNYPAGAVFHIEVENPEGVSYQWYTYDKSGIIHKLEGISATTDTLRIQSTQRSLDVGFFCIVTDSSGNETKSEHAKLTISNVGVDKPVLFIGEFALEPGQSINLAETYLDPDNSDPDKRFPLGRGKIEYGSNGTDITIDNLYYDNSKCIAGDVLKINCGLYLDYYMEGDYPEDRSEYHVKLNGENTFNNHYFAKDFDLEGIPFDFILNGNHPNPPTVYLEGNGSLHIINGSIGLRVIGNLSIATDVIIEQNDTVYSDGIHATESLLIQDCNIDIGVYGRGIVAENGNLFTKNATVNITSYTPAVSTGDTALCLFKSRGRMLIEDSTVRINSISDPAICGTVGDLQIVGAYDLYIDNSNLSIYAKAKENTDFYLQGVGGISANTMNVLGSEFAMNLDMPYAMGVSGISTAKEINIENSNVNVGLTGGFTVYGVIVNGEFTPPDKYSGEKFTITNSNFDLELQNRHNTSGGDTFGVICGDLDVGLGDENQKARILVSDGKALSVVTSDFTDQQIQPEPGYAAKHIRLMNNTYCTKPGNNQINQISIPVSNPDMEYHYQTAETIYNTSDMSLPTEIVFEKDYAPVVERVSWNRDQDSDLKLRIVGKGNKEGAVNKFRNLYIDDNPVLEKYYKVSKGSVVIDISKDYLQTLSDGTHAARAVFQDGEAQFKIIISRDPDKPRYIPPVTGVE